MEVSTYGVLYALITIGIVSIVGMYSSANASPDPITITQRSHTYTMETHPGRFIYAVACPHNAVATGGGYEGIVPPYINLGFSKPMVQVAAAQGFLPVGTPVGWQVQIIQAGISGGGVPLTVYVLCATSQ
jgi:hypothetical protein